MSGSSPPDETAAGLWRVVFGATVAWIGWSPSVLTLNFARYGISIDNEIAHRMAILAYVGAIAAFTGLSCAISGRLPRCGAMDPKTLSIVFGSASLYSIGVLWTDSGSEAAPESSSPFPFWFVESMVVNTGKAWLLLGPFWAAIASLRSIRALGVFVLAVGVLGGILGGWWTGRWLHSLALAISWAAVYGGLRMYAGGALAPTLAQPFGAIVGRLVGVWISL